METGTSGWQFRDEVTPTNETIVVHKHCCDSFYDTDLSERLSEIDVDHLVIGGCMTQFCVDTTTRRAVSLGFDVTLISDGHTTADFGGLSAEQIVDHHNKTLSGFDAGMNFVRVIASDEVRLAVQDTIAR